MLACRLRRRPNIKTTLGQCLVLAAVAPAIQAAFHCGLFTHGIPVSRDAPFGTGEGGGGESFISSRAVFLRLFVSLCKLLKNFCVVVGK